MLFARTSQQSAQLRDSYIAISNYVRGRFGFFSPKLNRSFGCQRILRDTKLQNEPADSELERPLSNGTQAGGYKSSDDVANAISNYSQIFSLPKATRHWNTWNVAPIRTSTFHGYITSRRRGTKKIDFIDLVDPQLRKSLQVVVDENIVGAEAREAIQKMRPHTPVAVTGQLSTRSSKKTTSTPAATEEQSSSTSDDGLKIVYHAPAETKGPLKAVRTPRENESYFPGTNSTFNPYVGTVEDTPQLELVVHSVQLLNDFPEDLVAKADTNFPPEQRHLQIRTNSGLRKTLQSRSKAQTECRKYLFMKGFDEIETPILFKSTPEGAREFLVPTRQKGLAYALPQSPQQFKQILMASGISKYFQFARCFRDEDMRADRQPEFTQLDIEMSFASAEEVMKITERVIQVLWETFFRQTIWAERIKYENEYKLRDIPANAPTYFPQSTYKQAMELWGSDKPDTRLGSMIHQVQDLLDPTLKSKITSLKNPIIDLMRVRTMSNPLDTKKFISSFMDAPSSAVYVENPHGEPGIFVFDPSQPMNGLSAFEHTAAEAITNMLHPARGDLIVTQARPNIPFVGEGSTTMGNLRRDLHMALVSQGIVPKPLKHEFLWITSFPLFSPATDSDPGQGGHAGIKSTHHPFTAPKTLEDVQRMQTDPLSCIGDHFDLVINGVEVGGGSRRIHDSRIQEMVLKDILKVPEKQAEEFRPLLEALRAGCPPHAGIALGFDRLMAIMRGVSTMRDVIAFPKSAGGEDKMVGAPAMVGEERWKEYHMAVAA